MTELGECTLSFSVDSGTKTKPKQIERSRLLVKSKHEIEINWSKTCVIWFE